MARYSPVKFYGDMKEALAPSKVTPIKYARPPTSIGSDIEAAGVVGERLLAAYLAKQKKDAEAADIKAAGAMADTFYKPQPDWNVETDGTTPDALRAATMPGALTGNVGATYDPNVKPMPKEYEYDGTDTVRGMAAALGAPNAALGSPLDPGQPYAAGTDEEGDDANWMNPEEHKAFYENEAVNAQQRYEDDNPTGMDRVNQGEYGSGAKSGAMRDLLMGDTIAKRENKEAIARAIATRDEERAYQESLLLAAEDRRKTSTALGVTNQRIDATTLDTRKINAVERKRLKDQSDLRAQDKKDREDWNYKYKLTDKGKKAAALLKAEHVKTNKQMAQAEAIARASAGARPLSLEQSKSGGFALRMDGANEALDRVSFGDDGVKGGGDDYDPTAKRDVGASYAPRPIANLVMSEKGRLYRQAKENWVTANLRRESGAVISVDEMDKEVLKYFPEAFDTPAIVKQKQDARDRAYAGMKATSGRAYDIMKQELADIVAIRAAGGDVNAGKSGWKIAPKTGQ
jgi:hypothetical protein